MHQLTCAHAYANAYMPETTTTTTAELSRLIDAATRCLRNVPPDVIPPQHVQMPAVMQIGDLQLDAAGHRILHNNRPIDLSRTEFALLMRLARAPHDVVTYQELFQDVWGVGPHSRIRSRTIQTHALRLRRKLTDTCGGRWVLSVHGLGYRLTDAVLTNQPGTPTRVEVR